MKLKIQILILILTLTSSLAAQEKYKITWNYKDLSFKEFVTKAESAFNVKFYYKDEWVSNLKLSDYPDCTTLPCVLDYLLRGTTLYYFIDESGSIVITKNYAVKLSDEPVEKDNNFIPPTDYAGYTENQQLTGNTFVEIGNPAERSRTGNVIISGYITNRDTREPVAGVTVFIQKLSLGTISNEYGFYTLTLPRGIHVVQFSFIGMRGKTINLNLYGAGEMNVEMNSMLIPLKETVVSAQKSVTLQRFEVGAEKINIASFKLLPTSMGESDIIKSVLLIPGVQSVGEGSSGFNVRGGSADQNLILLYGAPIYNSSHFFGFFSAVNSDIIKMLHYIKAESPAGMAEESLLFLTSGQKKEIEMNLTGMPA